MRHIWVAAVWLAACASDTTDDSNGGSGFAGSPSTYNNPAPASIVGVYDVDLSLSTNTCGSGIDATRQTTWEFRKVSDNFILVTNTGGQLQSTDGGHTFMATTPIDSGGCKGTGTAQTIINQDGDQFTGSAQTTTALTTGCATRTSCTVKYNALGRRQ